ncbi:MAG: MFS transporter [Eggerthellales bacterium]|nr:MFS transporter [Eggerthellales bacterium]
MARVHHAWLILVACFGFYSLIYGAVATTLGVFVVPVMEETGWSRTLTMSYTYIQPLVSAVLAVPAARIFNAWDPRWVLSGVLVLHGVTFVLPAFINQLCVWILYGVAWGVLAAFVLYLAVPSLVNAWFKKRVGLAVGLASAGISVFGALANPVLTAMVESMGWRPTRVILGVVVTLVALVLTVAFVRKNPAELGLLPYGEEPAPADAQKGRRGFHNGDSWAACASDVGDAQAACSRSCGGGFQDDCDGSGGGGAKDASPWEHGVPAKVAIRSSAFVLLLMSISILTMCTPLGQQLVSFGAETSLGAWAGAMGVSVLSISAVISKLCLGGAADRFGTERTIRVACATGVIGPLMMGLCGGNVAVFLVGAAIFGLGYSTMTVLGPLSVREAFGTRDFDPIYARITTVVFVFAGLGNFLYAVIYDLTGGYLGLFLMPALLYVVCFVIMPLGVKRGRLLWFGLSQQAADRRQ